MDCMPRKLASSWSRSRLKSPAAERVNGRAVFRASADILKQTPFQAWVFIMIPLGSRANGCMQVVLNRNTHGKRFPDIWGNWVRITLLLNRGSIALS